MSKMMAVPYFYSYFSTYSLPPSTLKSSGLLPAFVTEWVNDFLKKTVSRFFCCFLFPISSPFTDTCLTLHGVCPWVILWDVSYLIVHHLTSSYQRNISTMRAWILVCHSFAQNHAWQTVSAKYLFLKASNQCILSRSLFPFNFKSFLWT